MGNVCLVLTIEVYGVRDLNFFLNTSLAQIKSVLLGFICHFQNRVCHFSSTFCS